MWSRNGLSHPALSTSEGRVLFSAVQPVIAAGRPFGGASLEAYLLARHEAIDSLLTHAIERDGVAQVVEIACGLSPRGWRFGQRHGDAITYVEADLPGMAARKRAALDRIGCLSEHHRVVDVDALRDDGPGSLAALAATLSPDQGLAVITEGLLGYLPGAAVDGLWRRVAAVLRGFPVGRYLSDLHVGSVAGSQVQIFRVLLSAFVRGRVHLHFDEPAEAERAVLAAGFASALLRRGIDITDINRGRGSDMVHILEASST